MSPSFQALFNEELITPSGCKMLKRDLLLSWKHWLECCSAQRYRIGVLWAAATPTSALIT